MTTAAEWLRSGTTAPANSTAADCIQNLGGGGPGGGLVLATGDMHAESSPITIDAGGKAVMESAQMTTAVAVYSKGITQ